LPDHPNAPEQRTVDVDVEAIDTRGRTLHGYASVYGVESHDLGGFRERIAPGAFADVLPDADVRALLNHDPSQVLGRTKSGTLRLADESRGLRFECDLPDSPLGENVREAVKRGDIDGASFRFVVGDEEWDGDVRTVKSVSALQDVTVATYGAYPDASVELRVRPEKTEEEKVKTEDRTSGGGLAVEDRTAAEPKIEERIVEAVRSVRPGEVRSLTNASAEPISQPELSTFLWDRLRPMSVALESGFTVVSTDREKVIWPRLTADVDPTWVEELEQIPEGDPAFAQLEAEPKKLAHRVKLSNEVIDDSEPSVVDVLNTHLGTMLALKLDLSIFTGNPATNPDSIRGLKYVAGIQTIPSATNGSALMDYDPFVKAVGLLRAANVPGPYAIFLNPRDLTALELLKDETGSSRQLAKPEMFPPVYASSQLPVNETKGSASNASSAYVLAPSQLVLVRRQDAMIELDRSRLFDIDASEMRAKLRCDLLAPHPEAIVRIEGIIA